MAIRLGMEAKLYYDPAGLGGVPAWTELSNVKDVTLNLETGEESNILLGAVLKQLFTDEIAYVGMCYLIDVGEIEGDNQWRDYYLSEIDDPSTSAAGA